MVDNNPAKKIVIFSDNAGNEPFTDWLHDLRDPQTRRRILRRLLRVENGNYGDHKSLGDGINELRFHFGAGYRVYFGEDGDKIVVLLSGGDKKSQHRDIQRAQAYWQEYLNNV